MIELVPCYAKSIHPSLATFPYYLLTAWCSLALQNLSFGFFLMFYVIYTIMSLILLLNLLIAMMSERYSSIKEDSVLQYRVNYARRVLRLELQSRMLERPPILFGRPLWKPWDLHAGDRMGNDYMFSFRNVQANKEGGGTTGGEAMFSSVLDEDENEDTPAKKEGVELKRALARVTDGASIAAMERAAGGAGACIHGVPPCPATSGCSSVHAAAISMRFVARSHACHLLLSHSAAIGWREPTEHTWGDHASGRPRSDSERVA